MKTVRIAISAGHNPDGKVACGVITSNLKESTENRYVVKKIKKKVKKSKNPKIEVLYDCTINDAISQEDHLKRCAEKHNIWKKSADLHIQIHFNSFNGTARGSEVIIKKKTPCLDTVGKEILKQLQSLGFPNRGVKTTQNLYMLNHVDNFMILEVCFADNALDVPLYKSDKKEVVKAIYKGIWKGLEKCQKNQN